MNGEKVKQIVSEAFDLEYGQREAFVRKACGADQSLLAEALSLLEAASHAEHEGFLPSNPGGDAAAPTMAQPSASSAPQQFGRYKVLERIGEGGMGIVYRAEQRSPMRREVVVKVIKLGMDTKQVIARFEAERQALAMMDHPHIAKVYDAGSDDRGRPYFVMEYVKGTPILDYCDRNHLSIRQRLELFMQVCQAIQHAHHKGIIHRDIKPSNILVSTQDGKPFAKVIDFGIAKATNQRLTDRTLFTEHVNMIGTPAYMSPEQADGNIDIDTRTDVYSLGVVLYELLTGHTPFDSRRLKGAALNEIARIIREEDPPKPSTRVHTMTARSAASGPAAKPAAADHAGDGETLATLAKARSASAEAYVKSLQGEVDWMVMKAIEKDRARRYATPNELAEDVERHLNHLPILAAPPSLMYQARKFARKYRVPVAAGLTIALVLVSAVAAVSALAVELSHQVSVTRSALIDAQTARGQESAQRQEAERQRASAESAARLAKHEAARNQAQYLIEQKLLDQAFVAAREANRLGGGWEDGLLLSRVVSESRMSWHLEHSIPIAEPPIGAALAQRPEGHVIVVAFPSSLAEYGLESGKLLIQISTANSPVQLIAFRGPQYHMLAVTKDGIEVLSLTDLSVVAQHNCQPLQVVAADTGYSTVAITLSDRSTQVYSDALNLLGSQPWPSNAKTNGAQPLTKLAISPSGQFVISGGVTWWNDCLVWDVVTKKTFLTPTRSNQLRFIDDFTLIGISSNVGVEGITVSRLNIIPGGNLLPNLKLCAFPSDDLGVPSRHVADQQGVCIPGAWGFAVVSFHKDSDAFPDVVTQRYSSLLARSDLKPKVLGIADDGSRFALACGNRLVIFDRSRDPWQTDFAKGHHAAMGNDAMYELAPDSLSNYLHITPANIDDRVVRRRLGSVPAPQPGWTSIACGIAVSHDQRTLAVRYAEGHGYIATGQPVQNHSVVIYSGLDPATGRPSGKRPVQIRLITQDENADADAREYHDERILELSPDGKYLLVGTRVDTSSVAELYRTSDGQLVHYWPRGELSALMTSVGSSDYFADIAPSGDAIRLIGWQSGTVLREIKTQGQIASICGSAGGEQALVSIDGEKIARYDLRSGSMLGELPVALMPVACSPDGKVFIGYSPDTTEPDFGSMVLADGATGGTLAVLSRGTRRYAPMQFAADGQSFMLGSRDVSELVRNLSPESADHMLTGINAGPTNLAPEPPVPDLPPIQIVPKTPPQAPDASAPVVLNAADVPSLLGRVGTQATVQGTAARADLTKAKDALVIYFGERNKSFMVFVPPEVLPALDARFGGSAITALNHQFLGVAGKITTYRDLPEIKISDADQIQVMENPATAPAE